MASADRKLGQNNLTEAERNLFENLPSPPKAANIRASNVWIIEWLPPNEQLTGQLLHHWMKDRRPRWSAYFSCKNKAQVIQAIERATVRTQQTQMIPVLHIEAHGGDTGLEGPDGNGQPEMLTWDELTLPLQELNLATRCNLIVFVAACIGFAGIQALSKVPRAPAIALVGPDASVMASDLLRGTKEFYRRLMDKNPKLTDIAASASQEAGTVTFEWEPFVILAYDAFIEPLITSIRPAEHLRRKEKFHQRMLEAGRLSASEIECRLSQLQPLPPWHELQEDWNKMFMIDLYPENRERFGIDMKLIVKLISESSAHQSSHSS